LYRRCEVFFFPSYYEGFGLPVLEAMAFGAAVLSSNAGSLPEVMRRDDCLFDPHDGTEMTAKLQAALESEDRRIELRRGVQEHARGYQWKDCAEKALKAIAATVEKTAKARNGVTKPRGQLSISSSNVETWIDFLSAGADSEDLVKFENGIRAAAARGVRRVLVDVTTVSIDDARTGIQRVVRNFARGLYEASLAGAFEVRLIRWTENGVFYANRYGRESLGLPLVEKDSPLRVQPNDLLFMVDSSWNNPGRFDALNASIWEKGGEVVWMVYDLIPVLFPHTCHPGMPPAFTQWLDHVVVRADGFVCISDATRADLGRYIEEKCRTSLLPWTRFVHLGADLDSNISSIPSEHVQGILGGLDKTAFFIAIGTVEPRKDHATILSAFEELWAAGVECALVIVGKQGWNVETLAARIRGHKEANKRLFWLENLADSDLSFLLHRAAALIQASIAEGFGLPLVEAGSRGVPLLLSDIPVFREIAGDAAIYFPAGNAPHLAKIVRDGLRDGFYHPEQGQIETSSWRDVSTALSKQLLNTLDR
jgi:glycosyltransferase involved in cell wall biosynthesis